MDQDAPILQNRRPITAAFIQKCFGFLFFIWPLIKMIPPKPSPSTDNDVEASVAGAEDNVEASEPETETQKNLNYFFRKYCYMNSASCNMQINYLQQLFVAY